MKRMEGAEDDEAALTVAAVEMADKRLSATADRGPGIDGASQPLLPFVLNLISGVRNLSGRGIC